MSLQSLQSEVEKLDEVELVKFGHWFDTFRESQVLAEESTPYETDDLHKEEVLARKAEYLQDPSCAKVADAAYFAELRQRLSHAHR